MERKKLKSILGNIHESLKWTWQLIMGFALVSAVKVYFDVWHTSQSADLTYTNLMFILFVITFIRFLFGNNRYLDERYVEFLHKIDGLEDNEKHKFIIERTRKLSGKRRLYDILMLLFTGIIFVIIGKSIGHDDLFIKYYLFLMLINVLLLSISVVWNSYIELGTKDSLDNKLHQLIVSIFDYEKFPIIWIGNNLICVLVFYFIQNEFAQYKYLIFIAVFYINAFIDFASAWKLYFPPIDINEEAEL